MSNDIPLKFYDIVDEYETEAAAPVKDENAMRWRAISNC
ncbi:Protein of uncharacterised function (DUF2543) [Klebsiella pneumoniae]|uniref:Protein of uncharacterized function (DUF2543) n=1 Tax=Klebsiella pneumoniae TaxID=573 RepID=A0A4P0Y7G6_KLEPN|nr:Protein of uncharacterised function (DUF2543) [Klebsiella pneumoniae]